MILKIYWTTIVTVASGEIHSSKEFYSWTPIGPGEDCNASGLRRRWEPSGQRWAVIEVDWAEASPLRQSLGADQVLAMARSEMPGVRVVDSGIGSGLALPPAHPPPPTRRVDRGGLDTQRSFGWDTPTTEGGRRCRT